MTVDLANVLPESFYEDWLITEVLHVVKSGKEATVYCCRAHPHTGEKLIEWACEHFPCFRHDLPKRKLLGHYGLRDYAPTTSGLFILENSLNHDAPGLGNGPLPGAVNANVRDDLACGAERTTKVRRDGVERLSAACAAAARG